MSTKDLFDRNYLPDQNEKDAFSEVESSRNVKAVRLKQDSFLPQIDYSDPLSFAKFGSARLYYSSAISRILNYYPYDGSNAERTEFYNKSLDIEKYIFNHSTPYRDFNRFLIYIKKTDEIWNQNFNDFFTQFKITNGELIRQYE